MISVTLTSNLPDTPPCHSKQAGFKIIRTHFPPKVSEFLKPGKVPTTLQGV
jgi:hypothetical protein